MHTKAHEKLLKSCLLLLNWACTAESYGAVGPPYTFLFETLQVQVWKMVKHVAVGCAIPIHYTASVKGQNSAQANGDLRELLSGSIMLSSFPPLQIKTLDLFRKPTSAITAGAAVSDTAFCSSVVSFK